jgi:hypothetical protein
MTPGQYGMFVLMLVLGAIVIAMIKSFKVENDDAVRTDVLVTGHEIDGRAIRCAQRIAIRFGLAPPAVTALQKGLLYTHRQWLGDTNPPAVGEEFARAALERLWKLELIDESMRKDEATIKTIGEIVAESLAMDDYETRPMEAAEFDQAKTA